MADAGISTVILLMKGCSDDKHRQIHYENECLFLIWMINRSLVLSHLLLPALESSMLNSPSATGQNLHWQILWSRQLINVEGSNLDLHCTEGRDRNPWRRGKAIEIVDLQGEDNSRKVWKPKGQWWSHSLKVLILLMATLHLGIPLLSSITSGVVKTPPLRKKSHCNLNTASNGKSSSSSEQSDNVVNYLCC